jgi:AcrR family transcriptional regulator
MGTRTYRLERRATGLADTRQLFLSAGFHRASIEAIAEHAGVGRTTVFQQFGSKSGLLEALEQETSARAGLEELLRELGGKESLGALRAALETGCRVWAAEAKMFRGLFSLAAIDPEMHAIVADQAARRRQLIDALALRLQRQRRLRPGVTRRTAADLLWLLTSFESFDSLYTARGSVREVARLLLGQAAAFVELPAEPRTPRMQRAQSQQRPQRQPAHRTPRRPARA